MDWPAGTVFANLPAGIALHLRLSGGETMDEPNFQEPHREEQNLEPLVASIPSAIELADRVANSSEETAELFSSRRALGRNSLVLPRPDQV
jgi:hypothetical protein